MAVQFKKGDTSDPYTAMLEDKNGAVDIRGYGSVKFYMRNVHTGEKKIDGKEVTVVNEDTGEVQYEWDAEDVDTAGVYEAEVVVTYSDGDQTFPSDGFKSIKIGEDIQEAT